MTSPFAPSPVLTLSEMGQAVRRDDLDGDNWPLTWADDDLIYACYGDGWGCRPMDPKTKLNTGIVRISGDPPGFTGEEVQIPWYGGGAQDPNMKGVGMLCVGGVIYHTMRYQAGRTEPRDQLWSALIWSADHGRTWQGDTTYAERAEQMSWLFQEDDRAFGQPTFLQAGRDYAAAADEFVYVYSPREGRRRRNDHLDLARVPRDRVAERGAYQFFAGLEGGDRPSWSADISPRVPVLAYPEHVGGGDVVYLPGLKRYLLVSCAAWHRNEERPSELFILDAPHPWGPWTTVGLVPKWGTGLEGDCRYDPRLPVKWIREDAGGVTLILNFSDRTRSDVWNHQEVRVTRAV
jgi:uncharacterized protein DUF4185